MRLTAHALSTQSIICPKTYNMVFISLHNVVCNFTDTKPYNQEHLEPSRKFKKPLQVVVTPGLPIKQQNTSLSRASLFHLSTQRAPSMLPSFVLYVLDNAMRQKWVVTKSSMDWAQLVNRIRRAGFKCNNLGCCGHLQQIIKTSIKTRRLWGSVTHYEQCSAFQTFVNDLVLAVLGRDTPCEAMQHTRHLVEEFLEIAHQQSKAIDCMLLHENPIASPTIASLEPCLARTKREDSSDASADTCECPICCSDLADDQTLRLMCGHIYHTECVRVWLNLQHTCPVCQVQLKEGISHVE